MQTATFFTPSYRGDLERAVWMRRSVRRFFNGESTHIFAVPKRDISMFQRAMGNDTALQFVTQESLVDKYFYPDALHRLTANLAPSQLWRLKRHAGRPGWIIQQIAKLNCAGAVNTDAVIFLDSDLVFFRSFDLAALGLGQSIRTMVRITPETEGARHREHLRTSRQLLGLAEGSTEHTYMGYPAIWYCDWIDALQQHLQNVHSLPWQEALYQAGHISEYTLYGAFVDEVVQPANLHHKTAPFNRIAWDHPSFDALRADALASLPPGDEISLVIQSNIGIEPSDYLDLLTKLVGYA